MSWSEGDAGELLLRKSMASTASLPRLSSVLPATAQCAGQASWDVSSSSKAERNVPGSDLCAQRSPDKGSVTSHGKVRSSTSLPDTCSTLGRCQECPDQLVRKWDASVVYQAWQKQGHLEDSRAFQISKGKYSTQNMVIIYDIGRIPLWLLEQNQVCNVDNLK